MISQHKIQPRYDAIIVGARVAGAAAAMLLARAGMRVLTVERSALGSDTLSTHALMRAGVLQLHRWGLLDRIVVAGTPAIRRTTFHYGSEAVPIEIQERDGVGALYAPRRTVLDAVLSDAAQEAGAHVVHRAIVTNVVHDTSGQVRGVNVTSEGVSYQVETDIVIGADGINSSVARAVGAETLHEGLTPAAVIYSYFSGLDLEGTHWQYGPNVSSGAIPTNDDLACVFVAMRPERYESQRSNFDRLFSEVLGEMDPELALRVTEAQRVGRFYAFAGQRGFIRKSWGRGWALVGDASCFKDPITAHGITDALRDAEMLANAVITGTDSALARYQLERDAFAVEFLDLSDDVASFDWNMERLKALHIRLSKLMNRECELVRSFDNALELAVCA